MGSGATRGSWLIRLGLLAAAACGHEHAQLADAGRPRADGGPPVTGAADAGQNRMDAGAGDAAAAGGGATGGARDAAAAGGGAAGGARGSDAAAAGSASDADAGDAQTSLDQALRDYRGWTPRTAEPQAISTEIFTLCRLPSLPEQRFVESEHGKDMLLLRDWLNPGAARGFAAGGVPRFELDSAIVKQKLRRAPDGTTEVAALGLMVKRAPGFDPAHGDWEYGYWEAASGLSRGQESQRHCGDCHAGSRTDHVFLDDSWRLPP